MRFAACLQANQVPTWSTQYVKYEAGKGQLYALEHARFALRQQQAAQQAAQRNKRSLSIDLEAVTTPQDVQTAQESFVRSVKEDAARVHTAYLAHRRELAEAVGKVRGEVPHRPITSSTEAADGSAAGTSGKPLSTNHLLLVVPEEVSEAIKAAHLLACDLADFWEVNWWGFARLLAKFDAINQNSVSLTAAAGEEDEAVQGALKAAKQLRHAVEAIWSPQPTTELAWIAGQKAVLEDLWLRAHSSSSSTSHLSSTSASAEGEEQKRKLLKELAPKHPRLLLERGSGWREALQVLPATTSAVSSVGKSAADSKHPAGAKKAVGHHGPGALGQVVSIVLAAAAVLGCRFGPVFIGQAIDGRAGTEQCCLGLMLAMVILWCSEAIPLYITAASLPFLAVALQVLPTEYLRHHYEIPANNTPTAIDFAKMTAKSVCGYYFTPNILLLLGGFSIAASLGKYGVTKALAQKILAVSPKSPRAVLLVMMAVCAIASSFISNIAGSVLCFGLVAPMLRGEAAGSHFAKAIILGIAYAANIGGLGLPIASPQSVIGLANLNGSLAAQGAADFSFAKWIAVSLPIMLLSLVVTWGVLCASFTLPTKPVCFPTDDVSSSQEATAKTDEAIAAGKKHFRTQILVSLISALTIGLFFASSLEPVKALTGELGVLGIFPLVAFFGLGCLGKEDFNGFQWNVVTLAMGGSALGHCVQNSHMLKAVGEMVQARLAGMSYSVTMTLFTLMMLAATSFISHTVGASIFMPLVATIAASVVSAASPSAGKALSVGPMMLAACFTCSAGMGLPISGFPNMNAVAQEDLDGKPFVGTVDFLKTGIISSILFWGVIDLMAVFVMPLLF